MKNYFLFLVFYFLLLSPVAKSQIILQPLSFSKQPPSNNNLFRRDRVMAGQSDTLSLPFLDDFSSISIFDSLWLSGAPVLLNNRFSVNQPTKGIVTFDGLNSQGEPYDFSSSVTWGRADSLVSLPINLSYSNSDSVYLSFFYEAGGIGDSPDVNDSLALYFLDSTSTWIPVWSWIGIDSPAFQNVFLWIRDSYLYNGFRFKFISFGNLFGQHDIWNLDNIYINKNRKLSDRALKDVSLLVEVSPPFSTYRSIPLNHLRNHKDSMVSDEMKFSLSNYYPNDTTVNFGILFRDALTGDTLLHDPLNSVSMDSLSTAIPFNILMDTSGFYLPDSVKKISMESIIYLKNMDTFPNNDTIKSVSLLSDYYAYDDNSAEWGYGFKENYGAFAVKFVALDPDTLSQIAIHFPKIWEDVSNRNVEITVWKKIDEKNKGIKESIIYSQVEKPGTLKTLDSLTLFNLDSILIISDTFYVGFVVPSDEFIFVGLDRNTDASNQTFMFIGNKWMNIGIQGALLIRPVFNRGISTSIREQIVENYKTICFPNPNRGVLTCPESFIELQVMDVYGRIIFASYNKNTFKLPENLSKGIYFIKEKNNNGIFYQKIILQ